MEKESYEKYWVFINNLRFIEEAETQWEQSKNKRNFRLLKKSIIDTYNSLDYAEKTATGTGHKAQLLAFKEKLLEMKNRLDEKEKQINSDEPDFGSIDFGDDKLNENHKKVVQGFKESYLNLATPPYVAIKGLLYLKDEFSDKNGKKWFEATLERLQHSFQRNQHTDEWVTYDGYNIDSNKEEKQLKEAEMSKIPKI